MTTFQPPKWQLVAPLEAGLDALRSAPGQFRTYNPPNGWGNYEGFVDWVARYLDACREFPDANIRVSR